MSFKIPSTGDEDSDKFQDIDPIYNDYENLVGILNKYKDHIQKLTEIEVKEIYSARKGLTTHLKQLVKDEHFKLEHVLYAIIYGNANMALIDSFTIGLILEFFGYICE